MLGYAVYIGNVCVYIYVYISLFIYMDRDVYIGIGGECIGFIRRDVNVENMYTERGTNYVDIYIYIYGQRYVCSDRDKIYI